MLDRKVLREPHWAGIDRRIGGWLTTESPHLTWQPSLLLLGRGELLVTGGATQRAWQHNVPKFASAGPRMSLTFRHGLPPVTGGA